MSLLHHAPHLTLASAAALAREIYGLHAAAQPMPSERDQNFLLQGQNGEQFVLKIANAQESYDLLDAQNQALAHISRHSRSPLTQRLIHTLDGQAIAQVAGADGRSHFVRLLTYLAGTPLATVRPQTPELLFDLGRFMGDLDHALAGFDHPALHRAFHWDLARAGQVIAELNGEIGDPGRRRLVDELAARCQAATAPRLADLRRAVIHGDANDYNVLAGGDGDLLHHNQQIAGILDLGDMVFSHVVNDLAIAAAYALLDKPDPLAVVAQVAAGYHGANPLSAEEIAVLWDLTAMRLCMSVCHAAHQRRLEPDNEYLSISERPAWAALERIAAVHPRLAHYVLRGACGHEPAPTRAAVTAWLRSAPAAAVLGIDLSKEPVHMVDLGIASPLLAPAILRDDDTAAMSAAIFGAMQAAGARVGAGGYGEVRGIYTGDAFVVSGGPTGERRTVHLGLDLFAPAETPVYAPLAGTVAALADNTTRHDYGPVVLLRHATPGGEIFYTLYGHLSRASLDQLAVGQQLQPGDQVGSIGAPPGNGDWPPHLHLQILLDPLELGVDYPGVAAPSRSDVYLSLSPDPNLIAGIPADRFPPPAPGKAVTLAERRRRIGRNLSISYRRPLKIVRGLGVYLYDETGRAYLDCVNNVAHVGHCHPQVVAAGQRQMAVLNTNTRYLHDGIVEYARRLAATLPEPLSVCFFVNSGSEANDLALRLARCATGRFDMITLDVAYHGHTQALIEVSPYKHDGPGGLGRPAFVQNVLMPDPYRGPYKGYGLETGRRYAQHVQAAIDAIHTVGRGVAGFIAESLMGCGGQIVFPDGFLAAAFAQVRAAGGVCIADEVQTGFGRVGCAYWGFATQGVVPDIVTMGKPAGNGHPLAVVVTTPEIADKFANGMEYFNTFGGNPVSCAIGMAVMDVIEEERLQANALDVGDYLMARLRDLMLRRPIIGDVRGLGLYIGVELVLDRRTQQPAGEQAGYIANRMRDLGVLISTDGPDHNVLKIKPPIVFSRADADHLVESLAEVLEDDVLQV